MADHVVDTNVLIVASAADASWPPSKNHVPTAERKVVLGWLKAFHADDGRRLVLDYKRAIYKEYKNKLTDQDYGIHVARNKLDKAAWVAVQYDGEYAIVPEGLAAFDNSDKKLVAAHLAHKASGGECTIVNACDTDWHEHEEALTAHGVEVEQLLAEWCKREFLRKHPEKAAGAGREDGAGGARKGR